MSSGKRKSYLCERTLRRQATKRTRLHFNLDEPVGAYDLDLNVRDALPTENVAPEESTSNSNSSVTAHQTDENVINMQFEGSSSYDHGPLVSGTGSEWDEVDFCLSSSDSDTNGIVGEEEESSEMDITDSLRSWVIEIGIPLTHSTSLLTILRPHFPYLPKDGRTLLQTPRTYDIQSIAGGQYYHFGVEEGIRNRLIRNQDLCLMDEVVLQINIDGLPLFKSTTECFWPILALCALETKPAPFVIGLWVGTSKPNDANAFIQKFVEEMLRLQEMGIIHDGKKFKVSVGNFICDTPARSFVKRTKGHTGYYGCDYCEQRGVWNNHRMTFPLIDAAPRSKD